MWDDDVAASFAILGKCDQAFFLKLKAPTRRIVFDGHGTPTDCEPEALPVRSARIQSLMKNGA